MKTILLIPQLFRVTGRYRSGARWSRFPAVFLGWVLFTSAASGQPGSTEGMAGFHRALEAAWKEVFFDPGDGKWEENWFLDGERGSVRNTPSGMVFSAGPVRGDNGSHAVLWTRKEFSGDLRVEFDYTRLDDINYAVNILYLYASGTGRPPYFEDISRWSDLRVVPYMNLYFRFMNLIHISYAAYPLQEDPEADYVRARLYPVRPGQRFSVDTRIPPDFMDTGLFKPGATYRFTIIRMGTDLYFHVEGDQEERLFYWDCSDLELPEKGRTGLRHMYTRAARYANFRICTTTNP